MMAAFEMVHDAGEPAIGGFGSAFGAQAAMVAVVAIDENNVTELARGWAWSGASRQDGESRGAFGDLVGLS